MSRTSADLTEENLARDWTLSQQDLVEIRRCRGADSRLNFALQLCTLRRVGRFLGVRAHAEMPVRIINHLGFQLGLPPVLLLVMPSRMATRFEQERRISKYLGLSPFDDQQRSIIEERLRTRATRGLLADELILDAEDFLRQRQVLLPAHSTLRRMAMRVATHTKSSLAIDIERRLSPELRTSLDELLHAANHRTQLFALKQFPPEPNPSNIRTYLQYAAQLQHHGANDFETLGSQV